MIGCRRRGVCEVVRRDGVMSGSGERIGGGEMKLRETGRQAVSPISRD